MPDAHITLVQLDLLAEELKLALPSLPCGALNLKTVEFILGGP